MRVIVIALTLVFGAATLGLAEETFVPSFDREGQSGATPQKRAVPTAGASGHQSSLTPSASTNGAYRMGP